MCVRTEFVCVYMLSLSILKSLFRSGAIMCGWFYCYSCLSIYERIRFAQRIKSIHISYIECSNLRIKAICFFFSQTNIHIYLANACAKIGPQIKSVQKKRGIHLKGAKYFEVLGLFRTEYHTPIFSCERPSKLNSAL